MEIRVKKKKKPHKEAQGTQRYRHGYHEKKLKNRVAISFFSAYNNFHRSEGEIIKLNRYLCITHSCTRQIENTFFLPSFAIALHYHSLWLER